MKILKRLHLFVLTFCAIALFWAYTPHAFTQQDTSKKQTLVIGYPNSGIVIKGSGTDATRYQGLIYVKVFPVSPDLIKNMVVVR